MTIIVHHLNDSRSPRILWLLEELGVPYTIERDARDPVTRSAICNPCIMPKARR